MSGSPLLNRAPVSLVRKTVSANIGSSKARKAYEIGDRWDDHSEGRAGLIQWIHDIIKPSYCVIFSGDVHFGSFIKGKASVHAVKDQFLKNPPEIWSLDLVQITSSPMKNENDKLRTPSPDYRYTFRCYS